MSEHIAEPPVINWYADPEPRDMEDMLRTFQREVSETQLDIKHRTERWLNRNRKNKKRHFVQQTEE